MDENPSKYLGNELKYVEQVLNSENWSGTSGNWNQNLEQAFAKKIGVKYAIAMNSGTSTLHAALEAAGVKCGDEVITPALTVMMDTTAILHANAVPVYADTDRNTFNIDPRDIEKKITGRTKAIIAVALYGLPPDYDPILELAEKYNLIVIEDNAQCFLSTYKGKMTGTIGDMASYSFENTKHISCGEGGILVTNNEEYAEKARKVAGHGFKNLKASEGRVRLNQDTFQNPDYKRHDTLGWNYRLSEVNAAIALAQLERIDELVDLRINTAKIFMKVMNKCDYLVPQFTPKNETNSYYTLGVKYFGDYSIDISWQEFRRAYIDAGGDGIYGAWAVPYTEPMVADRTYIKRCPWVYIDVEYKKGLCPMAEETQPRLMQFKTNYRSLDLAQKKADILSGIINKFSKR